MDVSQAQKLRILPVILAGGVGARLAPISTPERPKPFVPLADGESLLTKTLARVRDQRFLSPLIIGRAADRFALLNHARAAGVTPSAIILEDQPRNTAPAIALAARWAIAEHGPFCMLAILPADHAISPQEAWRITVHHAAHAAHQSNEICLLTATPTRPETGFGYVAVHSPSATRLWQKVERFVEKPADPHSLIMQGARWNMGQFVGAASRFAALLESHAPVISAASGDALGASQKRWEFTELPAWPTWLEGTSFDYAVLEKAPGVALPFTGQWQDLGNLDAWRAFTGLDIDDYLRQPARTDRPWGYFEQQQIRNNEVHKQLILYPNCRLSLQRHQRRAEHWRVLAGTAYVELEDSIQRLEINQEIAIPAGSWHRLANHHSDILIIKEIQMGICDESDIERAEDDYGRK